MGDPCDAVWDRAGRAKQLYAARTRRRPTVVNLAPGDLAAMEAADRGHVVRSLGGWPVLLGMRVYPVSAYAPGTVMVCRDDSEVVVGIAPGTAGGPPTTPENRFRRFRSAGRATGAES